MNRIEKFKAEFARALRNFRYERSSAGILFPLQKILLGGIFHVSENGGPWAPSPNTVALEGLDALLTCYFNNVAPPSLGGFIAPFSNNTTPSSSLTAATFAATQGEYTGYTQSTRVQWTSNGASSGQTVSNSASPAAFTIGSSAVTVTGAGLIMGASAKGATTGTLAAAALFSTSNSLSPASTLSIQYSLSAAPSS
jgi:hypothetical protein